MNHAEFLEKKEHFLDKARSCYAKALELKLSDSKNNERTSCETRLERTR